MAGAVLFNLTTQSQIVRQLFGSEIKFRFDARLFAFPLLSSFSISRRRVKNTLDIFILTKKQVVPAFLCDKCAPDRCFIGDRRSFRV